MHPMGSVKWTMPKGREVDGGININTTVRKAQGPFEFLYYLLGEASIIC